ncbi:MAG: AIM24 family protein [Nocardiopsaceae bacterium]|nr:AIM24 family protein [Nocardiopsaceae bacterium]
MSTYTCRYCRQPSDASSGTCPLCGAPTDIREEISDSGWVEQPAIRDMARLQFGQSHCQIVGAMVPVAEFSLAQNDMIYFSHHVLLWTELNAQLTNMPLKGAWNRKLAGLPLVMVEGRGPGRIALSDNHAGEVIALPLGHGEAMWVREHRFLCSTGNIKYHWDRTGIWYTTGSGDDSKTHYPMGMFGDTFAAEGGPGLLLLHARGNTFIRDLSQGQTMLIQPSSLLYRDLSVRMQLHLEYPHNNGISFWSNRWSYRNIWVRLHGPGRVAVQSAYAPPEDAEPIRNSPRGTTRHRW